MSTSALGVPAAWYCCVLILAFLPLAPAPAISVHLTRHQPVAVTKLACPGHKPCTPLLAKEQLPNASLALKPMDLSFFFSPNTHHFLLSLRNICLWFKNMNFLCLEKDIFIQLCLIGSPLLPFRWKMPLPVPRLVFLFCWDWFNWLLFCASNIAQKNKEENKVVLYWNKKQFQNGMNHPFFNLQLEKKKKMIHCRKSIWGFSNSIWFIIYEAILCLSFWQCGVILLENGLVVLLIHSRRWFYFVGTFEGYFCFI